MLFLRLWYGTLMGYKVKYLCELDFGRWDAFVRKHPSGTFCHLAHWKSVLEKAFGLKAPYIYCVDSQNNICGIMPLGQRSSWLFGKALISSMFCVYGGPLVLNNKALDCLIKKAQQIRADNAIPALELRTQRAFDLGEGWFTDYQKSATFVGELAETDDKILCQIPRKQRAVVRKSLKNSLECFLGHQHLDVFYDLYAESVRNLGTPVFSKALFQELVKAFGNDVEILIVKTPKGKAVASLMSFYDENTVYPYYAGGIPAARQWGAHDFMYYDLMCRARKKGIKFFDFGRSKVGTGPFKFKKNWGFTPTFMEYQYFSADRSERRDISPANSSYTGLIDLWKKLPLPVASFLGTFISKHLG